ncbi:transposase family protein [Streptomyces sp. NBC_01604]|uniref:transposase family protein n=1 Tax=Streptomyces sp. NBC_01604 TaxID=2975894 RepID=UPI00386E642C
MPHRRRLEPRRGATRAREVSPVNGLQESSAPRPTASVSRCGRPGGTSRWPRSPLASPTTPKSKTATGAGTSFPLLPATLLWASPALAGAVHSVRAVREHGIIGALAEAGINCWAELPGRRRHGPSPLPRPMGQLSAGQRAVNRSHAKVRALVEQAIATLKSWQLPRKLRCSTTPVTSLVQAVLTLHPASSD